MHELGNEKIAYTTNCKKQIIDAFNSVTNEELQNVSKCIIRRAKHSTEFERTENDLNNIVIYN